MTRSYFCRKETGQLLEITIQRFGLKHDVIVVENPTTEIRRVPPPLTVKQLVVMQQVLAYVRERHNQVSLEEVKQQISRTARFLASDKRS